MKSKPHRALLPTDQPIPDGAGHWWTLEELAVRWKTSLATLRRDSRRPEDIIPWFSLEIRAGPVFFYGVLSGSVRL
jgi:hypothetical protein